MSPRATISLTAASAAEPRLWNPTWQIRPVSASTASRSVNSAMVVVGGFSSSTSIPARSRVVVIGAWVGSGVHRIATSTGTPAARKVSRSAYQAIPAASAGEPSAGGRGSITATSRPRTRALRTCDAPCPWMPMTAIAGPAVARRALIGRSLEPADRLVAVPGSAGDLQRRWRVRRHPVGRVAQDLLDGRVVVDGVLLVSGTEVEDLAASAPEGQSGPEHLAAVEAGDEDRLVDLTDVERLAVHLRVRHDHRVGDAVGDRVPGRRGPDQLAAPVPEAEAAAGGADDGPERLGVEGGVQRDEAHPLAHPPTYGLGVARRRPRPAPCGPTTAAHRSRPAASPPSPCSGWSWVAVRTANAGSAARAAAIAPWIPSG